LLISTVVWRPRNAPATNAREVAAADRVSGLFVMSRESYGPKTKQESLILPPGFSIGARITKRSSGLKKSLVRALGVAHFMKNERHEIPFRMDFLISERDWSKILHARGNAVAGTNLNGKKHRWSRHPCHIYCVILPDSRLFLDAPQF